MPSSLALSSKARISAHTVRDHLTNPACEAPGAVPWCAEAITPAWLSRILCRDNEDYAVTKIDVSHASSGSSVRKRLAVTYNADGE